MHFYREAGLLTGSVLQQMGPGHCKEKTPDDPHLWKGLVLLAMVNAWGDPNPMV